METLCALRETLADFAHKEVYPDSELLPVLVVCKGRRAQVIHFICYRLQVTFTTKKSWVGRIICLWISYYNELSKKLEYNFYTNVCINNISKFCN